MGRCVSASTTCGCGFFSMRLREAELHEESGEWNKVEDYTNIEASGHLVYNSCKLVEASSFSERDITTFLVSHLTRVTLIFNHVSEWFWCLFDVFLKLVLHHSLCVEIRDIHDYLKSYEVNDAMVCGVLVCQESNVDALAENSHKNLDES